MFKGGRGVGGIGVREGEKRVQGMQKGRKTSGREYNATTQDNNLTIVLTELKLVSSFKASTSNGLCLGSQYFF